MNNIFPIWRVDNKRSSPILEKDFFDENKKIKSSEKKSLEKNSDNDMKPLANYFDHIRVEAALRNKLEIYEEILKNLEKKIEMDSSKENIENIFNEARMYEFSIICGFDFNYFNGKQN
jgi:hypothetical protein